MFAVIGVLLPVAFAIGIAARKPVPSVVSLPAELATIPGHFTTTVWARRDLFEKVPVAVRLLRESTGTGAFAISFTGLEDFTKPDLIVY